MAFAVTLDGGDIREHCQRITHKAELNIRSFAEVLVPSELISLTEGGSVLSLSGHGAGHGGVAYFGEDTGSPDDKFSSIQSYSPMVFLDRMQVMDADGDYSDPDIIEDNEDAVSIFGAALDNWSGFEGSTMVSKGSEAGGGSPLIGMRPVDWPMSIEQLRELLVGTGQLDVVENMGGATSTLDLYNGDFGSDLTGSVQFGYGTGAFNCVAAKYTYDFTRTVSRIRYFLGPKRPQFDGDIQHWAGDVQIDDGDLDDPPFDALQPTIEGLSSAVEGLLSRLRRIDIFDSNGDENALRDLYMHIWQSDALVHFRPRRLLNVTPEPGVTPSFVCGDLISVAAVLRDSHSGAGRVYSYTAEEDTEGNVQLSTVTVSADQET